MWSDKKKLIEHYDLLKDPIKVYFHEKMQQLMGKIAQLTEKSISDNYLGNTFAKDISYSKRRATFPGRLSFCLTDIDSDNLNAVDSGTHFETRSRKRSSAMRFDRLISEIHGQFRESISSVLTDKLLVLDQNTCEVRAQLQRQDQDISDRLSDRRVKSLHKSINNSFIRSMQINCYPPLQFEASPFDGQFDCGHFGGQHNTCKNRPTSHSGMHCTGSKVPIFYGWSNSIISKKVY